MRVLGGDADRPLRDAEEEVDGAVERVDDPAHAARALAVAALLPQDAVVGPGGRDPLADQPLGVVVGLGDEVGRRALGRDPQLRARGTPRAAARPPRGRPPRPARAARPCVMPPPPGAARASRGPARAGRRARRSRASESGGPTSWTPSGKPSPREPGGHRDGRLAGVVEGAAVGREAHHCRRGCGRRRGRRTRAPAAAGG